MSPRPAPDGRTENKRPVWRGDAPQPAADNFGNFRLLFRPQDALVFLRDRSQAFVNELLHALPAIGLGYIDVAFRIGGDAVRAVEFTGLASALSKGRQNFERIAQENVDAVV